MGPGLCFSCQSRLCRHLGDTDFDFGDVDFWDMFGFQIPRFQISRNLAWSRLGVGLGRPGGPLRLALGWAILVLNVRANISNPRSQSLINRLLNLRTWGWGLEMSALGSVISHELPPFFLCFIQSVNHFLLRLILWFMSFLSHVLRFCHFLFCFCYRLSHFI